MHWGRSAQTRTNDQRDTLRLFCSRLILVSVSADTRRIRISGSILAFVASPTPARGIEMDARPEQLEAVEKNVEAVTRVLRRP